MLLCSTFHQNLKATKFIVITVKGFALIIAQNFAELIYEYVCSDRRNIVKFIFTKENY